MTDKINVADTGGFEWQSLEHENPLFFTLEPIDPAKRGHGGSHPHLVHEFTRSIVEGRRPAIDAIVAADWTAPGMCAHESALRDGERVDIPDFRG